MLSMVKYEAHGRQDTLRQVRDVQAWDSCPIFALSTWGTQGLEQNVNVIRLETRQLLGCVIAVIADNCLRCIKKETNSVKESLALQPFDDIRGDCPNHHIHVSGFFWLLPFLVTLAQGFRVELRPLVWVAVLVWASMGSAVTGGIRHGDIWPLVLGSRWVFIHRTTSWGVVSCHQNVWIACPITAGDICNALKSIGHPWSVGQITESGGFDALVSSVN